MSIMMIMEWDGITAAQYDQVRSIVNWEGNRAKGGLFHVAAVTPEGLRVTDVWDSAEEFNQFVETRLMPGVAKAGITSQPRVEIFAAHAVFAPGYKKL
jgi:hypothetical protein